MFYEVHIITVHFLWLNHIAWFQYSLSSPISGLNAGVTSLTLKGWPLTVSSAMSL